MPELRLIINVGSDDIPVDPAIEDPHTVADSLFDDHGPAYAVEVLEAEWAET